MEIMKATYEKKEEIRKIIERLMRLNGEYDKLLQPTKEINSILGISIDKSLTDERYLMLIALDKGKVIGVLRAELIDREFFEPRIVGKIGDIYVLPEHRRMDAGFKLLQEAESELKKKGAQMIFAEFPLQNSLAVSFYKSLGFRPLTGLYAKETKDIP